MPSEHPTASIYKAAMHITGKRQTFNSWHRQDQYTDITLLLGGGCASTPIKRCLILNDENESAVILLDSISDLIAVLKEGLEEINSRATEHKTRRLENGLSIRYDNRGEPYCQGLTLSFMTNSDREEEYSTGSISVFLHTSEVRALINALHIENHSKGLEQ